MRPLRCVWFVALYLFTPVAAKCADLQDAFKASLGQFPPLMRQANLQNWGEENLRLEPLLLVRIGGTRYALIISESFNGAHAAEGDVAVAYLDHGSKGWRPIRVWYEFDQTGSFGTPFSRNKFWSFKFGTIPFFSGESEYCGMGACTRGYDLIGLSSTGPVAWGGIPASGALTIGAYTFPDGAAPNGEVLTGCGGYEYSSKISAPEGKDDLMHVTYSGWMIPGGSGQKRRNIRISTELSLMQGKLRLHPDAQLPNCGS